ncbi:MAG: hypothetical protein QOJ68_2891 [Blastococcus sp.]|jgi:hypothetical protein|nr:hypothetical protein [Blastococcus sp.]
MQSRTTSKKHALIATTELSATAPHALRGSIRRPPTAMRRSATCLGVAAAGALMVNVLWAPQPTAHAAGQLQSVSIAEKLGVSAAPTTSVRPLEQLVADRSQRLGEQTAAAHVQAAADRTVLDARAAAAAKAAAAKAAAAKAAAAAAAAKAAAAKAASARAAASPAASSSSAAAAPSGSYQSYALSKVGSQQFSCLESLWGRESGWNPNAQNPSSSAYGIPQFLDSTWASTGIAKTSNGYRQIDAGLSYLDSRYGSPCGGWAHSQSTGWY